jgi:gamma-glutamyl-gamma-aminobutyrate hydrolase PuuD
VRRACFFPTVILQAADETRDLRAMMSTYLVDEIRTMWTADPIARRLTPLHDELPTDLVRTHAPWSCDTDAGLLFVPGEERKRVDSPGLEDRQRHQLQASVLKEALHTGRPVLAVCEGAIHLWRAIHPQTAERDLLVNVRGHTARCMPYLKSENSTDIGHNVIMHGVAVEDDTLLAAALLLPRSTVHDEASRLPNNMVLEANSVHWHAPNPDLATCCRIGARSVHVRSQTAQQNVIESFELPHGAPVLGTMWHPEAFNTPFYRQLITFMAHAGSAWHARMRCVRHLRTIFSAAQQQQADEE